MPHKDTGWSSPRNHIVAWCQLLHQSIEEESKKKQNKKTAKRQRHKENVAGQKVSFSTTAWLLSPGTCYSADFFFFPCLCCGGIVTVQVTRREWQQQALSDRSPEPSQLGHEPSRGKFTPTPSWPVSLLDVSLGMAEERERYGITRH